MLQSILFIYSQPFKEMFIFTGKANSIFTNVLFTLLLAQNI